LRDTYRDVGSRWKNALAVSTFTTFVWFGNAGAVAEKVRMRGIKPINFNFLASTLSRRGGSFFNLTGLGNNLAVLPHFKHIL